MKLTVVGSGDAFGTGGRLHTCFHVATAKNQFLIDCGATALTGLEREGIATNDIDTIILSHLHGDHFGGLVWWMIHARHISKRKSPLAIVGPRGTRERLDTASEALFPGASKTKLGFEVTFYEHVEAAPLEIADLRISAFEVRHPCGAPPYALRIEADGKTISYSGDTEWTDALIGAATGADLYISECYAYERTPPYHLNWPTIEANLDRLNAKRIMLTHMGREMLDNRHVIAGENLILAEDGLRLDV